MKQTCLTVFQFRGEISDLRAKHGIPDKVNHFVMHTRMADRISKLKGDLFDLGITHRVDEIIIDADHEVTCNDVIVVSQEELKQQLAILDDYIHMKPITCQRREYQRVPARKSKKKSHVCPQTHRRIPARR